MFQLRHINRLEFPTKHVIVLEDDLTHQKEFAELMSKQFPAQGKVGVVFSPSAIVAALMIEKFDNVRLLILDHDMPYGNGSDLIHWMGKHQKEKSENITIVTASDIPENNDRMEIDANSYGIRVHRFEKSDVIAGKANKQIKIATSGP